MSSRSYRHSGSSNLRSLAEIRLKTKRFRRLRSMLMETLEDRRVLANQIVLDFSPDIIDSEYQVERFSSVFASEPVSVSNQFLDYNSDGMISGDDAEIALHRISARVHRLLNRIASMQTSTWWFGSQRTLLVKWIQEQARHDWLRGKRVHP